MDQRIGELHYRIVLDVQISSTQPRISVVIPLYNYDVHVVEALQSISLQTIQGIELIVVDDGSKDRSFEVAKKWLDANQASFSRVVLAQNAVNSGLPYTRNVGFTIATTDSVFPIDADNLIYPRCLERCHAAMQRHDVAVVYTIIERFGAEHRLANLAPWSRDTFRCGNQIDAMALDQPEGLGAGGRIRSRHAARLGRLRALAPILRRRPIGAASAGDPGPLSGPPRVR